ncbi:protein of unknown function DUF374 [alpha proteobacterium U9-1i]|nr:protein of unknown function DUF374 [alpha proteobacterium U9-1i]
MSKQLIGNPVVQFLIGRTLGLYMLLVGATTRWAKVNRAAAEPYWAGQGNVVLSVWHGRFMLAHTLWRFRRGDTKAVFLISRSREGEVASHASRTVGAEVIRGSAAKGGQQKGGLEAVRELVRQLEDRGAVGMTPDGPRGPRMRVKMGPVQVAKLAQAPILCLAWSTNWRVVLNSWDRMIVPLPFGRGVMIWGDPIAPPSPEADQSELERVRAALEAEMNRISGEADRMAGVEPIDPAPPRAATVAEPVA